MFWILRWVFISILTIVVTLGLAFGFKQMQNKYYPAYQHNEFTDNDFSGNKGSLKEAIQNAVTLLQDKKYSTFLVSYIPEEGKEKYIKEGRLVAEFVSMFEKGKSAEMLEVLTECASQDHLLSVSDGGNTGVCTLAQKKQGKNKMTFMKERGSWRIEN